MGIDLKAVFVMVVWHESSRHGCGMQVEPDRLLILTPNRKIVAEINTVVLGEQEAINLASKIAATYERITYAKGLVI